MRNAVSIESCGVEAKPGVSLRNVEHLSKGQIKDILRGFRPQYVKFKTVTSEGRIVGATAIFDSNRAALDCLSTLHNSTVNGKGIRASLVHWQEPVVTVSNLPGSVTEADLLPALGKMQIVKTSFNKDLKMAVLVFADERDAELAEVLLGKLDCLSGEEVEVSRFTAGDLVVRFIAKADASQSGTLEKLLKALSEEFGSDKLATIETRRTSVASFLSFDQVGPCVCVTVSAPVNHLFLQAKTAKDLLLSKQREIALSEIPRLTAVPAYAVEVQKLPENVSVADLLKNHSEALGVPIATHRNAILKIGRHEDLVPAVKQVRKLSIGSVAPYRPLVRAGDSEYDVSEALLAQQKADDTVMSHLGNETLHSVVTRYRLLFNEFERLYGVASRARSARSLLGQGQVPDELFQEAQKILNDILVNENNAEERKNRLFDIFIQREDKLDLSEGIEAYMRLFGRPVLIGDGVFHRWISEDEVDEDDSEGEDEQANANSSSELQTSQSKALDRDDVSPSSSSVSSSTRSESSESGEEDKSVVPNEDDFDEDDDEDDNDAEVKGMTQFSATEIRDEYGFVWQGTVLDTDSVQKTMPGKRIASSRALVVIGNMRGTAGFGSGKGKTAALAVEAAFRAALKNLVHIDLYENTGLAHDCFGKHNSCKAYVRATPPSRLPIASPFAEAVLSAFGVGSASVKLVGRRNPYSMVNALFNALSKHENIDEYAKRRGKRYLTLKWLKDHNV